MLNDIKKTIEEAIETEQVQVLDPQNDMTHLQAIVVSKSFEGMPLVKRHKSVMNPLKNHFATTLHALALKTYTPQEWERISS
ncbi:MAG: BolA family transcriptional regulator [Rhabdochlamydiaceae bacterium]|nr:BolA family transcriptional regulator [Candidatus Amphrikana amoebophyrae]